jgi:hypothetical protein
MTKGCLKKLTVQNSQLERNSCWPFRNWASLTNSVYMDHSLGTRKK